MSIADVVKRKSACTGVDSAATGPADDLLVDRSLAGDAAAFDRLVIEHRHRIHALARLVLGDAEEAQDIAQETFVRAFEALPRYRRQGQFRTWIDTIAVNLCKNRLKARRAAGPRQFCERIEWLADPAPGPEERALGQERALAIREAIEQMSDRDRLIVVLYYLDEASCPEIAQIVGCRAGAVKVALHRARARLRGELKRRGFLETTEELP